MEVAKSLSGAAMKIKIEVEVEVEVEACPFCGNESVYLREDSGFYVVGCICGAQGPDCYSKQDAVETWNKPRRE